MITGWPFLQMGVNVLQDEVTDKTNAQTGLLADAKLANVF